MHLCFIDESGDCQTIPHGASDIQPLIVIAALLIDADKVKPLTTDFLNLKRRFYPQLCGNVRHDLDILRIEIKGCDLRKYIRRNQPNSNLVKHTFRFIDAIFMLITAYRAKLVGAVWIKQIGRSLLDQSIYTRTTQEIATRFQIYLEEHDSEGMIIADFRDPRRNSYVAHSIFTQKYKLKKGGDAYPNIDETAVFGISENHACLQIVDILASSVIFPSAARVYCYPTIQSLHTAENFDGIRSRYKGRLKKIQYNCYKERKTLGVIQQRRVWGLRVIDCINSQPSICLFQ